MRRLATGHAAGQVAGQPAEQAAVRPDQAAHAGHAVPPGQAGPGSVGAVHGRPRPTVSMPGWLVPVLPAVAELLAGGYRIGGPSLWRDEAATISGSQRPLGALWALVRNQDAVHGFYYLLMHGVIAAGGISAAVLRLPSLVAMCLAVGLTALLGRRLARAADLPFADVTGLLAGLMLVAVPLTTRYAQEARPYALTTLFAVLATYLLVRGAADGRRRWWAGYATALALTGLFNLFAVLLAVAHGVSLYRAGRPDGRAAGVARAAGPAASSIVAGTVRRWAIACAAAAVPLVPVAVYSAGQSGQLSWVRRPDPSTVASLLRDFAGTTVLVPVAVLLVALGLAAGRGLRRGTGLTLAVVAAPWLVLPPVILLAVSLVHPVYVERYVIFCLPALALLGAAGLIWLGRLAAREAARRGIAGRRAALLAVAPSALLALLMAAALAGPQAAIRSAAARPDNLRAVAAVVARYERPGDAVLYLPWDAELAGVAYPGPFRQLRNVGLAQSPVASATLRGLPAGPPVVAGRLSSVRRLWTVAWAQPLPGSGPPAAPPVSRAIAAMRLVRRWRIASVVLTLYSSR